MVIKIVDFRFSLLGNRLKFRVCIGYLSMLFVYIYSFKSKDITLSIIKFVDCGHFDVNSTDFVAMISLSDV